MEKENRKEIDRQADRLSKSHLQAYMTSGGVWQIHTVDAIHTNCSGGEDLQHQAQAGARNRHQSEH